MSMCAYVFECVWCTLCHSFHISLFVNGRSIADAVESFPSPPQMTHAVVGAQFVLSSGLLHN